MYHKRTAIAMRKKHETRVCGRKEVARRIWEAGRVSWLRWGRGRSRGRPLGRRRRRPRGVRAGPTSWGDDRGVFSRGGLRPCPRRALRRAPGGSIHERGRDGAGRETDLARPAPLALLAVRDGVGGTGRGAVARFVLAALRTAARTLQGGLVGVGGGLGHGSRGSWKGG